MNPEISGPRNHQANCLPVARGERSETREVSSYLGPGWRFAYPGYGLLLDTQPRATTSPRHGAQKQASYEIPGLALRAIPERRRIFFVIPGRRGAANPESPAPETTKRIVVR